MPTVRRTTLVVEAAIGMSLQQKIHNIMMLDYIPTNALLRMFTYIAHVIADLRVLDLSWSLSQFFHKQCISSLVHCGLNKHNNVFSHPVQDHHEQSFCTYWCVVPSQQCIRWLLDSSYGSCRDCRKLVIQRQQNLEQKRDGTLKQLSNQDSQFLFLTCSFASASSLQLGTDNSLYISSYTVAMPSGSFSNYDKLPKPAICFLFALNEGRVQIVIIHLLDP